jgi:hypothetical protein
MDSQLPQDLNDKYDGSGTPYAAHTNGNAWLTPAKLPGQQAATVAGVAPIYDLRPLTTGEILDRTFSLYRSRFWLFAGIAAISGGVQVVGAAAQMVFQHYAFHHMVFGTINVVSFAVIIVANLLFLLAYSVTQATTAFAVSEVYLGRQTSIGESLRATIGRWLAYIGIAMWQLGSFLWMPFLLIVPAFVLLRLIPRSGVAMLGLAGILMFLGIVGGGVAGIIFLLRNSMAIPATVVERLKVRASMRRSKVLAAGAKGRLFLVGLISYCLYMVVGILQAPLAIMMVLALRKGHESIAAQAGTLVIGFVGHSVVTPVAMIGFTLVYFDQRVRKEAFDLVVLLGEEQAAVVDNGIAL